MRPFFFLTFFFRVTHNRLSKRGTTHHNSLSMHFNIMNEAVNESLRKICHYQQNVLQHYYLLDTLVLYNKETSTWMVQELSAGSAATSCCRWIHLQLGPCNLRSAPRKSAWPLTLFIIFINDLPSALPDGSLIALYADDTKLYDGSILSYLDADKL